MIFKLMKSNELSIVDLLDVIGFFGLSHSTISHEIDGLIYPDSGGFIIIF